jgi:FKBP-type peptidyl-prolyl cis-trans isomerase
VKAKRQMRQWAVLAVAVLAVCPLAGALAQDNSKASGAAPAPQAGEESTAAGTTASGETPAAADATEPAIRSRKDKISYAFGADLARDLKRQKSELNIDLLMRALTDGLADKPPLMTDEQVTAALKQVQEEEKQDLEHAKMMIFEKNRKAATEFFSENAKKQGVVTLPSGLQYKILKQGDGKVPVADDVVLCNYTGKLLDGTEIDSSYKRKEPTAIPVKGVIPGFSEALKLMPVGSTWQLFVPPQLAYGDRATPAFGPNTTLVFEVELLSIKDKPQTVGALQARPDAGAEVR